MVEDENNLVFVLIGELYLLESYRCIYFYFVRKLFYSYGDFVDEVESFVVVRKVVLFGFEFLDFIRVCCICFLIIVFLYVKYL